MRYLLLPLLFCLQLNAQSQVGIYYQGSISSASVYRNFNPYQAAYYSNMGISYEYKSRKHLYRLGIEHLQLGAKQLTYNPGYLTYGPSAGVNQFNYFLLNSNLSVLRKIYASKYFEAHAGLGLNLGHVYAESFKSILYRYPRPSSHFWGGDEYLPYNFYLAPEISLRLEFHLNSKFSFVLAPEYSYQIRDNLDYRSLSVWQVNMGFMYQF